MPGFDIPAGKPATAFHHLRVDSAMDTRRSINAVFRGLLLFPMLSALSVAQLDEIKTGPAEPRDC